MKTINYTTLTEEEILNIHKEYYNSTPSIITLELIEQINYYCDRVSSEETLNRMFEEEIERMKIDKRDKEMLRFIYNRFLDQLEEDGEIHPLQAQNYNYNGEFFN